ncbi:MAG: hypothetical protein KC501_16940 [Myxococcales bacterium]|nr:hypothetical protein [Myxococcales bacterium]
MRALRLALPCSLWLLMPACQADEVGGVDVSIARAQLDVSPGSPDGLATLDLTIELQARDLDEEVTLVSVEIVEQPVSEGSPRQALAVEMVNTTDEGEVLRLDGGAMGVGRINNIGTTNGQLESWCRKPVQMVVVVDTMHEGEAEASADTTVRCP